MKFDEVLKQLEPSMAVPMYPKALLIDFMREAYDEGFKACAKARLNVTTISDCPIKDEEESKCKIAYIKGIRTMANALKDYDRTDGAWTDYFEHTVEEVLNRLLKEIE